MDFLIFLSLVAIAIILGNISNTLLNIAKNFMFFVNRNKKENEET